MAAFNVQHFTSVDVANSGGTSTLTTVVLANSIELANNNLYVAAGPNGSGSNQEADDLSVRRAITATTTLTYTRSGTGNSSRTSSSVWEYTGSAGGPNEFIVRDRRSVDVSTGTASFTPSGISDRNQCCVFISGITTSITSEGFNDLLATAWVDSSGVVQVRSATNQGTVNVSLVTVEFTGSNWTLHYGTNSSNADTGSITLTDSSDGTGTTSNVSDWADSLIVHQLGSDGTTSNRAISDVSCIFTPGTGTSAVDWAHNANHATSAQDHRVTVIENSEWTVTRYSATANAANESTVDITSAGLTSTAEALIFGSSNSSGGGTAFGRGLRNYYFNSTTQAAHWCHRSGNTMQHRLQIVDLNGMSEGGSTTDDLLADDVESSSEITAPSIGQEHALTVANVESTSEVSAPTVGQEHNLTPTSVESASEVTAPSLSESHILDATDTESASEVTSPSLGQEHQLTANEPESASEASSPALGQEHGLNAADIESASEVTAPVLTPVAGTDNLLADDVESASEVSAPALGQEHALLADDTESSSEVNAPEIGQVHDLTPADIESTSEVTAPVLTDIGGSVDPLLAEDVESVSEVSAPEIGQEHALTPEDVESLSEISSPQLGQEHVLSAVSVESVSEVTAPALAVPPRVWLNTTPTLVGATEMVVTAFSDTEITFDDPAGGLTGNLWLGVENQQNGDIAWIQVTVNAAVAEIEEQPTGGWEGFRFDRRRKRERIAEVIPDDVPAEVAARAIEALSPDVRQSPQLPDILEVLGVEAISGEIADRISQELDAIDEAIQLELALDAVLAAIREQQRRDAIGLLLLDIDAPPTPNRSLSAAEMLLLIA